MERTNSTSSITRTTSKSSNSSKVSVGLAKSFASFTAFVGGKRGEGLGKGLTLLVEGPGIGAQVDANKYQDVVSEETGEWQYLVIDPSGIRPREDAVYSKDLKKPTHSNRYKEGSVCAIDRRRTAGWTTWLSLKNGDGWLFDVSPKDKKVRLVEVEVAVGAWHYECVTDRVPIMPKPHMKYSAGKSMTKAQVFLSNREVVQMQERVRPLNGKGSFLRLADGRGWAVDFADGQQVLQRQWQAADSNTPCQGPHGDVSGYGQSSPASAQTQFGVPVVKSFLGSFPADCNDPLPGVGTHLGSPELGEWEYIVVDPKGMSLRSSPTYDQGTKLNKRVEEGEVVVVLERIPGNGTVFLRLASPSGWCFERTPSSVSAKQQRLRMMPIQVDKGLWYYTVVADRGVALRSRCTFSENSKVGKGPLKGALCEVTQRVRAGESTFLYLKDGSGWVFDVKNGKRIVEGPIEMQVLPPSSMATVRGQECDRKGGINLSSSPTKQRWATTKFFLMAGSKVRASMICEAEMTRWIYVTKGEGGGGGIEGWAPADVLIQEVPTEASANRMTPNAPTEAPAILNTSSTANLSSAQAWGSSRRIEEVEACSPLAKTHTIAVATQDSSNATNIAPSVTRAFAANSSQGWCGSSRPESQGVSSTTAFLR